MERIYMADVAAPMDLPIIDDRATAQARPASPCTAMIVCHGMGQQVPFETLDAVANAIADEHMGAGGEARKDREAKLVLRFVRPTNTDKLYPRAELTLKETGQADKTVHLYEAYWAPLTEGAIGYSQTAAILIRTGVNGLVASWRRVFQRWMFGAEKTLPIDRSAGRLLLAALLIAAPILLLPLLGVNVYAAIKADAGLSPGSRWAVALATLLWLGASIGIRRWIVQYMGDVIIYVSSNEVNSFWKIRDEIKHIGLSLAKVVYGAAHPEAGAADSAAPKEMRPLYSDVVVVGHSLGSVIAYDTLNAIINQDQLNGGKLQVVKRTQALITLGSPLDKVAFLFRQKAKNAFIRDVLSAAYQPMILSYDNRPRWWINIFSTADVVSGSLEYYDDPQHANSEPRRVMNFKDPAWLYNPVKAHTDYWKRPFAKTFLYRAACGDIAAVTKPDFKHSAHHVPIRRHRDAPGA
jgi:hypothetical protein